MNKVMNIEKLKKWVIENYNQRATGFTSERSFGNFDDCFEDGTERGTSCAAYEVGQLLGMKLKAPVETDWDC